MENMKLALMKRIREEVPEIATIDEDYGQLEVEEDQYPVVFPAVLINADGTEWKTLNAGQPAIQRGDASSPSSWQSIATTTRTSVPRQKTGSSSGTP